jgi:TniQ
MDKPPGSPIRPLGRSLDPLDGESLGGYLLRLSYRLRLSPIGLARQIVPAETHLSRRLLLDLDIAAFADTTRLTADEAAALTLIPYAPRYPPIVRSLTIAAHRRVISDRWLFNNVPRHCPQCLVGDGSAIQQQYGGPWRLTWHLPICFACTDHRVFLRQDCPGGLHPPRRSWLISRAADSTLHPTQCRRSNGSKWNAPACAARLDRARETELLRPNVAVLETQRRLLYVLDPHRPAESAARYFTDLRMIAALLSTSWPLAQDLVDGFMTDAVGAHVRRLGRAWPRDTPPTDPIAAAGLLTAATAIRDSDDLQGALARHLQATWTGCPSGSPWARLLDRHGSSCSEELLQAAEPIIRTYRRTGCHPHGTKAPSRTGGYRPEHIPALLKQRWYQQHLAPLGCQTAIAMRRTGSVLLVQWAAGGSMTDAADFLGIRLNEHQHSPAPALHQWLRQRGSADFTAALHNLARELEATPDLIDYHHRRQALRGWCLDPATWRDITDRLPPVPGTLQPTLHDRKRQEASAFVWVHITQGEPRFAPRPIEAEQPEPVRRTWTARRSSIWFELTRPNPLNHYAELRKLLTQHAEHLAKEIDTRAEAARCQPS